MPGNTSGNRVEFTLLADLIHVYPNGTKGNKNPEGFVAAETFWAFFESVTQP